MVQRHWLVVQPGIGNGAEPTASVGAANIRATGTNGLVGSYWPSVVVLEVARARTGMDRLETR